MQISAPLRDLYDRGRTDNTAGNAVLELYHFSRALPHPAEVLQQFAAMWQQDTPPQDTPWGQNLLAISLQRAQGARALLQAAARTAAKDEAADFAYTAVLQEDADRVTWMCQVLEKGDWDRSVAALGEFDTAWRRAGRIKGGKDGNPCAFAASELRARAKKQIESLRTDFLLCTGEEYAADRRRAAPLVAALVRVTQQFADACFAAKCEEKLLDYADFEHLTLDLLLTPDNQRTPLCRTVSSHYSAVLVDEYQDTNALQDAIYFALARSEGDNLFFVGDIKQSIYRFRQADPQVFVDKQQRWQAYPQPAPQPASLALDANFRSAPGVIAGINYLFEVFFSQGLGGVAYGDGQRLVVGAAKLPITAASARSMSLTVPGPRRGRRRHCRPHPGDDGRVLSCATRPASAPAATMISAFCCAGAAILPCTKPPCALRVSPVFADTAADLLDEPHIRPFAALLRVIDNPAQDIPLAAVLLSPMFPYTADDLVTLRGACPEGSLYGAVLYGGQPRFAPFLETLAEFRRLARTPAGGRAVGGTFGAHRVLSRRGGPA